MSAAAPVEVAWFSALCDDDYEQLGVADPALRSSWLHCSDIVRASERAGFDSVLLPSGYSLGIDSTAFAAGVAGVTERIRLLLAVRLGELVVPQLARQLATVDQMAGGRLAVNLISSDLPGETLASAPRYRRTLEIALALRDLLDCKPVDTHGEFMDLTIDPPSALPQSLPGMQILETWSDVLDTIRAQQQGRHRLRVVVYPCAPLQVFEG